MSKTVYIKMNVGKEQTTITAHTSLLSVMCRHRSGKISARALRAVHCTGAYIARNNMQVQFIRFRKKISPLFRLSFSNRGIQCIIPHRTQFQTRQGILYCHSIGLGPSTGYNWYPHPCQVRLSPFHSFAVVVHPSMLLIYAD